MHAAIEFRFRYRRRLAHVAIGVGSRRPAPGDELVTRHMIDDRFQVFVAVFALVEQRPAKLARRQVFPRHGPRREVPIGGAGYAAGPVVFGLVTRRALLAGNPLIRGATRDGRHVQMRIEALLWRVAFGMTVQTARMSENAMDVREQLVTFRLLRGGRGGNQHERACEYKCYKNMSRIHEMFSLFIKSTVTHWNFFSTGKFPRKLR